MWMKRTMNSAALNKRNTAEGVLLHSGVVMHDGVESVEACPSARHCLGF
jgi:hypothetical protein